ncbi:MAG: hypothetical protein SH820_07670 [Xanthomonadales bacterium]|nr:hypothetical protein [Xanthomonadales bacterium]
MADPDQPTILDMGNQETVVTVSSAIVGVQNVWMRNFVLRQGDGGMNAGGGVPPTASVSADYGPLGNDSDAAPVFLISRLPRKGTLMRKFVALILSLIVMPAVAIEVPVNDLAPWTTLTFNNIPPNEVSVEDGALHITVRSSASPLIYGLEKPTRLAGVTVLARWSGEVKIPEGATQGDKGADDFVLKFGIVEAGEQTLNWLQRQIAADWIKQLFRLAPRGTGVRRINFLATVQQPNLLGTQRTHPLNDLLHETRITFLEAPGAFEMAYRFDEPVETLGLWISSDGDDTSSSFDLEIQRITLHTDALPAD